MRTLLLTAAALSAPHAARVKASVPPIPGVSVSIDKYVAPLAARDAYDDIIADAAERYDLDPRMIKAVMETESAFNAMAVSPVGALGLM
jgi:soluble lytic murein transglycosylase-like protein